MIIIINLELYKSQLDILIDILLNLLLAGQYMLVILVMAPEWRTMGLPCNSPSVSTKSVRGSSHEGRGHGMGHRAVHRRPI